MTTIQAGAEPRTALPGGRGVRPSELTIRRLSANKWRVALGGSMFRHDHLLRAEVLSSPRPRPVRKVPSARRTMPDGQPRAGNRPPFALPAYICKYVTVTD